MMDRSQRADETAEDPAQEKGQEEQEKRPPESLDEMVSRDQGGQPDKGIQLKEELYWPANSQVHL